MHSDNISSAPPLPEPLPLVPSEPDTADEPRAAALLPIFPLPLRSLRAGCYLLNYTPVGSPLISYDGTLRVEAHADGRTASGDLYQRRVLFVPIGLAPVRPILGPPPNPAAGIPILPRAQYRYYVRVTQILERFTLGRSFTLGFELWRFTKAAGGWSTGGTWTNEGPLSALMTWQAAPPGHPSASDYLAGDVKNASGNIVGRLTLGWVSKYLRKATIELDRVAQSEAPLDSGSGSDWKQVGDGIDWELSVDQSDQNLSEPSGEFWSDAECHATMLARRDASNLDSEWRYYVLSVRRLDSTVRGIMFDAYGGDSNNVPREGCAISSHWTIPSSQEWGSTQGKRFGAVPAVYFRTAVHETGHAFGLYHNTLDNGFMNTTDQIAAGSLDPGSLPFPDNVQWSFEPGDAKRLRHTPDIYVRPGGTPFGTSYAATPISPADLRVEAAGLELRVTPIAGSFPIGAPVRVDIELVNRSGRPLFAPENLKMKSGFVKGTVFDPAGSARPFSPLLLCVEDHPKRLLAPEESVHDSLTLLRGSSGALFPMPGLHRVVVEVSWDEPGIEATVTGEASVMVTAAEDAEHAQAAARVLSTPDALLTLVLGGDHLADGREALNVALESRVLRPHFAYIEAKRLCQGFFERKPDTEGAAALLDDSVVMSTSEVGKANRMLSADGSAPSTRAAAEKLARRPRHASSNGGRRSLPIEP